MLQLHNCAFLFAFRVMVGWAWQSLLWHFSCSLLPMSFVSMQICGPALVSALPFLIQVPVFFLLSRVSQLENIPSELLSLRVELPLRRCVPYGFEQSRLSTYVTGRLSTLPTVIYHLLPALRSSSTQPGLLILSRRDASPPLLSVSSHFRWSL